MSKWLVSFTPKAEEDLDELSPPVRKKIIAKLEWTEENFEVITPLSLGGLWQGFYKLRIGDWRVIYKINWHTFQIIVVAIGHRSDIYRKQTGY